MRRIKGRSANNCSRISKAVLRRQGILLRNGGTMTNDRELAGTRTDGTTTSKQWIHDPYPDFQSLSQTLDFSRCVVSST